MDSIKASVTDDGSTIVCWHPKKSFPYEHSLPYVDEDEHTNSIFKVEHSIKGENIYFKGPVNRSSLEELQAITYTPKHVWRKRRTDGLQLRPAHPRKGV
ncbi:hypothetical protein RDWZM_008029 [Blomia tropicalis]|uniref:Large ribosomal subunit protein mL42 n=1 Tax=Blomia tropicalis TaxID=40697 RepID=A0A9Q0M3M3_BLOTA|nr:hypothetical protein RDWZM_008029 [Blomia tropicalis]